MKKQMLRVVNANLFSNFFKATVLVVALGSAAATSQAATAPYEVVSENPGFGKTIINYLGGDSESLLFEVKLSNNTGERFTIIVKDEANNTIYRGWFSGVDFSRKFRLPKSESDKISFIIRSESGKATETFQINSSRRIVEDVVVKKVF